MSLKVSMVTDASDGKAGLKLAAIVSLHKSMYFFFIGSYMHKIEYAWPGLLGLGCNFFI